MPLLLRPTRRYIQIAIRARLRAYRSSDREVDPPGLVWWRRGQDRPHAPRSGARDAGREVLQALDGRCDVVDNPSRTADPDGVSRLGETPRREGSAPPAEYRIHPSALQTPSVLS